ncbi:hypothetical protein IFM89_002267 [Coptis chinensis]|uniref:VDE lipocalin domain-containing protein n=1 Tax=Coptis chinensis TaxID=261450 RepID=A0A835ILR1_9MAGN|nr:hypothetical protein IFM89_002267 [Coptis chinensis]
MLQNLRSKGFSTLNCMVKNCGMQVLNCLLDPNCRNALQCLNKCSPTDQDLCHEAAEDLFVGWMGGLDWSWRVVAGQNPAYDHFSCQYQLFYRGKARGSFCGAAKVARRLIFGVVLVSPNGEYPDEIEKEKLISTLEKCGIKEWELYIVDNCSCQDPPLGIPEGSTLHIKIEVKQKEQFTV